MKVPAFLRKIRIFLLDTAHRNFAVFPSLSAIYLMLAVALGSCSMVEARIQVYLTPISKRIAHDRQRDPTTPQPLCEPNDDVQNVRKM